MLVFKQIEAKETYNIILNKHYAKRKPSISFAFGCYENDVLVGVLTIGKPVSNQLCEGLLGKEYKDIVYELNRICFIKSIPNSVSQLISYAMKSLKHLNLAIVSYADTGMHHTGYVYQATNFIYTGKTPERTDKFVQKGKHSRHYKGKESSEFRVKRTAKHRYVYFTASKTLVKKYKKLLKYPVLDYPKTENKNYILGEEFSPELVPIKK